MSKQPARVPSLIAGLAVAASACALAGWSDALRVSRGAMPPLSLGETAGLAYRSARPLLAALFITVLAIWTLSASRSAKPRHAARASASGFVLACEAVSFWMAALAVLVAGSFGIKVGWIAGALLAGALAGFLSGRGAGRLLAGRARPTDGRVAAWGAGVGLLAWAPMILAAPAIGGKAAAPRGTEGRPNIVLIVVDALRADHLGAYGYARPTSPALDALAASGALFADVVAPSSWTLPSMASIFTSSQPGRHGTVHRGDGMPQDLAPLPLFLEKAGYDTAGFAPNPWLKRAFGFDRGFDLYYDIDRLGLSRLLVGVRLKNMALRRLGRIRVEPELVAKAPDLTRRALDWLASRPRGAPFFLYLHLMDVHSPYDPPPPFHGMFCPGHRFEIADHMLESRFRSKRAGSDPAILDHVVELYDESIVSMDRSIEGLRAGLRALGLSESTLVVLTSDHGEEFLDHGDTMHGRTLYQEVIRVPMIASGPGVAPGSIVADRVTTLDLLPTLLDLAGVRDAPEVEGRSLARLLEAGPAPERDRPLGSQLLHGGRSLTSLFAGTRKVILARPAGGEAGEASVEAYDLAADPGERDDVAARDPEAAAGLKALAIGMEGVWGIPGARSRRPGEKIDPETLEQLEALGYLN